MNIAQALAAAARFCGVRLITHVPGFGATETFTACQELMPCQGSLHEEVAFGMAQGAALTGHPSLCLIKMHGLLKASNALVCALSMGVTAGFVTVVFEDPTGAHSDNLLPTRRMLEGLEIPVTWVEDPQEAPRALEEALRTSQRQRLPRVLVMNSDLVTQEFQGELDASPLARVSWSADPVGELVCPLFGAYQRGRLLKRLGEGPAPGSPPPLPELDRMPPRWQPSLQAYRPWMEAALASGRPPFVAGDTGLSSILGLEPLRAVDVIGWMGGSLPLALGALAGGMERAWAVTGDFAFAAAGLLGWVEARRRGLPLRVLLFDNASAQATGGQPVEQSLLEGLLGGPEVVIVERPEDLRVDAEAPGPLLYWLKISRAG